MRATRLTGLLLGILSAATLTASQAVAAPSERTDEETLKVFLEAVAATRSTDYKLAVRADRDMLTGAVSTEARATAVTHVTEYSQSTFVTLPDLMYAQGEFGFGPEAFIELIFGLMRVNCAFAAVADPAMGLSMAGAATTADKSDDRTIRGTFDLSRIDGPENTMMTVKHLRTILTPKATAIPFTAVIEDRYVRSFETVLPRADGTRLVYRMELSEIGATNKIAVPPDGKIIPAPPELYE
ncbi:hypothetical protein [Micromonospora sp. NPDC051296]|uniref:hypothetical protein n=1 Tax=Micromonospora sp. NPDC051296 TaxID=3155046 RepID=UPI00342F334A